MCINLYIYIYIYFIYIYLHVRRHIGSIASRNKHDHDVLDTAVGLVILCCLCAWGVPFLSHRVKGEIESVHTLLLWHLVDAKCMRMCECCFCICSISCILTFSGILTYSFIMSQAVVCVFIDGLFFKLMSHILCCIKGAIDWCFAELVRLIAYISCCIGGAIAMTVRVFSDRSQSLSQWFDTFRVV